MTAALPTPYTVVVMPAFGAALTLAKTVADLPTGHFDHVLLVDDASTDDTVAVARALGLDVRTRDRNGGYGANQKTCYREALALGATIVVLLHPDYQYDPQAIPRLIQPIQAGEADVVFGSRFGTGADPRSGGMPQYRYLGNRLTSGLQNLLLGTRFSEFHSGMRAYTRTFLESVPFETYSDDFVFDTQMLVGAHCRRFRIAEVPIPTRYTQESSSISISRSLVYVLRSLGVCLSAAVSPPRHRRRSGRANGASQADVIAEARAPASCPLCHAPSNTAHLRYQSTHPLRSRLDSEGVACTTPHAGDHGPIYWCATCQVGYSPCPDPSGLLEQYTAVEDPTYLDEEPRRLGHAARLLTEIERWQSPGRLLEVGSSVGCLLHVAQQRGWQPRGIEASAWAVATGTSRYGVTITQGTIESASEDPASADCVVMIDVLEHLFDPQGALDRCATWLAPGGTLALLTVNMTAPLARLLRGRWPGFMDMHLTYFSPRALQTMVERSGLIHRWTGTSPRRFTLGYVGGRLRDGGPLLGLAARIATLPGLRSVPVTLRSRDLLLVIAQRPER